MIERITEVIRMLGLTSSQFADEIGVQRSAISHLMSGRNNPSLDFIMKVTRRFPEINLEWLLNGTGPMTSREPVVKHHDEDLFSQPQGEETREESPINDEEAQAYAPAKSSLAPVSEKKAPRREVARERKIERILIVYNDNTFRELRPE